MKSFRSFQLNVWSGRALRVALAVCLSMIAACGGGGYGGGGGGMGGTGMSASAPHITSQPTSQSVPLGATATFSVTATSPAGYGLSYQWMRSGAMISGANAASYTTPATTAMDNGAMFSVTVTNSYGSTPSNQAMLTVMGAAMMM
jgi:hypothetical protein